MTTTIRHRYTTTKLLLLLLLLTMTVGRAWAATTVKYERGGGGTAWSDADLTDWKANPAGTTFSISSGLYMAGGNASYEYQKSLDINSNARLTITATWNTGSSLGRAEAYNYLSFGSVELRAYGQGQKGSIVINGEETILTTNSGDVRDNNSWTISLTITQTTGAVSYTITMPSGEKTGTGNAGVLDFQAIKMGYLKTGSLTSTHQTLTAVSISEETYTYTVNATGSISQKIVSSTDGPDATITVPYHRYILDGTTLHRAEPQGSNPHYGKKFTLSSDGQTETVTYASVANNVVVFKEAEGFLTPVTNNNYVYIRCSGTQGGYATAYTDVATLPSGAYNITAASYGRPTTFTFRSGEAEVWTHSASAWGESSSGNKQLNQGALQVQGGSSSYPLDYVYVQRVFAYETASSDRNMSSSTTGKPTLINTTGETVTYTSSNTQVATVDASGNVTFLHNGTAYITAKATIDAVEYWTTHKVIITGETNATETWDTSTPNQETYTLSGTGYVAQTSEGSMITINYGNASELETQTVDNGHARCIDANGYSHAHLSGGTTGIPDMGTYYAFTPKVNGTLTINALVSEDGEKGRNGIRLIDSNGNVLERKTTINADYVDYAFGTLLIAGRTYYVLAETDVMTGRLNTAYSTLWLHSFTFKQMEGTTISLIDQSLLFTPNNNANSNRLNRTIPGFDIKFGGDDGAKYQGSGTFIFRNSTANSEDGNGSITITPRIKTGEGFTFNTVKLNIGASVSGSPKVYVNNVAKEDVLTANNTFTYSTSGNTLTIKLKGSSESDKSISFLLNSITFTYTLNSATLDDSKGDVTMSFAKPLVYGYNGDNIENDFRIDSPLTYDGEVSFYGNVDKYGSGSGFWNGNGTLTKFVDNKTTQKTIYGESPVYDGDGKLSSYTPYKVLIGQGVCMLQASTAETEYFKAGYAETRLYSRDYVEERSNDNLLVLAPGETYSVPAGGGYSFKVVTSGGSISLSNTAQSSTITVEADKEYATTVSGGAGEEQTVTITNNGASNITIKRIEVSRKKPTLDFGYRGAVGADDRVLFTGWSYMPTDFVVTGETNEASKYETTGTYAITQAVSGVTLVDAVTGQLNIDETAYTGVLEVTLTVNPKNEYKADYAPITKTLKLKVVDGMWDFRTYSRDEHYTMYNSEGWGGQVGGWYAARDNAEFADILRNDGTPLPRALALQTKGKHRLLHTDHGCLHLQGQGSGSSASANGGGQLLVPVKAGMLVEVNSYSEDLLSEMEIDGVTDLEGNDVTMFYVDPAVASQYFLAKSDGYVIVRNPSTNLDLHIKYIKVSAEMAFEYGNVTYVDAQVGKWTNRVMNQGTTTIAYGYSNNINTPVTAIDSETGEVTIGTGAYGKFTVTATGSGTGVLAGKTNTYTAYAIGFSRNATSSSRSISESNEFDLKSLFDVEVGNITSTEPAITAENLKNQIIFSLVRQMPSVTLSGSTLTIEGVQTVTVKATLGAIEKTFTCEVTGATISFSIDGGDPVTGTNIVIPNTTNTLAITVSGDGVTKYTSWGDVFFDRNEMERQALGDIKAIAVPNPDPDPSSVKDHITTSETGSTLTITFDHSKIGEKIPGGVIPIIGKYVYGGTTYDITGTVTVAYSSHTWDFQHNLLTVSDATHGYTGLVGWQTADNSKTAEWNSTYATIDQPTDDGDHKDSYNWKFVRKIGGHTDGSIVYYYNHSVEGNNALAIPETEGLRIFSSPSNKQLGVEMMQTGGVANVPYDCRNLMLLRGGKLIIPMLKKGQWVEVRWTRHKEEMGERIVMENLSDVEGTPITSTYKIANCFYDLPWSTSSYMFQATEDGNVSFEVADNIYVSIQQIILHEPNWDFQSNFAEKLRGYDDVSYNKDIVDPSDPLYNKKYKDYTESEKSAWTGSTAPQIDWQYIWDDQNSHTITVLQKQYQNAPRAPQKWTFEMDDMLKRAGATMVATGEMDQEATVTYNGGWGKVKITMTSYSQNMKYVANKKSWTITFGQAPKQTYPYTWDFTKFFTNTLGSTTNDLTWAAVAYSGTANPLRVAIYNNHSSSNYGSGGWANSYNKADYESYYVEGAQLVSYGLRNTNNGVIRETAGLGFKLDTDRNGQPDQNMLLLNMTNTVATPQQAVNGQTWITDTGETDADKHTGNSHLTIGSGGIIIVPKPNDADHYNDYYIYIKSSHKPTTITNVTDRSSDVPTGVYKYQFSANANAEFTFTSDDEATDGQLGVYTTHATPDSYRKYTDIYAIAVTKDYKTVKRLNGVGWATESRSYAVDYTLNELLTTRPMQAYSVIARSSNPIYSVDKTKTTVRLQDRNYVVPAKQGLVLKQAENSPGADGSPYTVPLFVPAVTTAIEPDYSFTNNLMRPNLTETTFAYESENFNGSTYVRFILSDKYMTWRKEGNNTATYDEHFVTGTVPGFYRMHVFSDTDYDSDSGTLTGSNRNTLAANKAYLLLRAENLNYPLWNASSPARRFDFVGIEGVSDMEDITDNQDNLFDNGTYNLRGQKVNDDGPLPPGIYIRNGKKIIVK